MNAALQLQSAVTYGAEMVQPSPSGPAGAPALNSPSRHADNLATVVQAWSLDRHGALSDASRSFGLALRLFGLERFRDGQLPVVAAALSGHSVLVVSPTGFGKTLCFQLPSILRPRLTVVVSPLNALMTEQVSTLLRRKIPSTFVNSDLDGTEKRIRYQVLANGWFKLLYAAPERFFVRNPRGLPILRSLRPAFLVVDDAHCVDQWPLLEKKCSNVFWHPWE